MNCLFIAYFTALFARTGRFSVRSSSCGFPGLPWNRKFEQASTRTVNFDILLTRFRAPCYSTRSRKDSSSSKSKTRKVQPKPAMDEEKNAFFVIRKGDLVGVYKNLSDCQAQVGSSICDPPVSVYKGYTMSKETEDYLRSCGLRNALYSVRAADLTEELFGSLLPCPFQEPPLLNGETSGELLPKRTFQETGDVLGLTSISNDPPTKLAKLDQRICILEFDGASKGNPGKAGAGAVLRTEDGSLICRLREGLGVATNNVAEYRAMILGLRYALKKGFTNIRVQGDSKLVCMQVQGLWKVKNENISRWYEEAAKLKDRFLSFRINHVLREFNSDADAEANFAIDLADGQVKEVL